LQVFIGIQSHLNQTPMCIYNKNIPISDDNPKTSFGFILDDSFSCFVKGYIPKLNKGNCQINKTGGFYTTPKQNLILTKLIAHSILQPFLQHHIMYVYFGMAHRHVAWSVILTQIPSQSCSNIIILRFYLGHFAICDIRFSMVYGPGRILCNGH